MLSELKKHFTTCVRSVIILTHGPNIHMGMVINVVSLCAEGRLGIGVQMAIAINACGIDHTVASLTGVWVLPRKF